MIKILIADDHAVVRRGIRQILAEARLDFSIDEAGSAGETMKAVIDKTYDIVLLDIAFADGNGLDVLRQIHSHKAQTRVLLLSMYPEEQYALRALRLGACGYLTKDSVADELVYAIQKVASGGKYITPSLSEQLADEINMENKKPLHATLSVREFQIMTHLAVGKSIGAIAAELSLSPKTVSTYRTRVLEKLNLKSTAEIIRYALENKLDH